MSVLPNLKISNKIRNTLKFQGTNKSQKVKGSIKVNMANDKELKEMKISKVDKNKISKGLIRVK